MSVHRKLRTKSGIHLTTHGDVQSDLPLLYIHGQLCDSKIWEVVQGALAGRPSAAMDLPGHGESRPFDPKLGIRDLGNGVVDAIETLEVPSVDAVAHSLGCLAALTAATTQVRRAVLLAPPPIFAPSVREELRGMAPLLEHEQAAAQLLPVARSRWHSPSFLATSESAEQTLLEFLERNVGTGARHIAEAMANTTKEDLACLDEAELHFVYGDEDVICPPPAAGSNALGREGQRHVIGGPHLMFLENPTSFAAELRALLADPLQ